MNKEIEKSIEDFKHYGKRAIIVCDERGIERFLIYESLKVIDYDEREGEEEFHRHYDIAEIYVYNLTNNTHIEVSDNSIRYTKNNKFEIESILKLNTVRKVSISVSDIRIDSIIYDDIYIVLIHEKYHERPQEEVK